jgi:hypothetical protein
MEKIILDELVKIKLKELTATLFKEEYFGFVEDAENYVNTILDLIFTIPTIKHKRTLNT